MLGNYLEPDPNAAEGRNQTRLTASRRRLRDIGVTHALCADAVACGLPLNERCMRRARMLRAKTLRFFRDCARKKWPLRGSSPRRTRKKRCVPPLGGNEAGEQMRVQHRQKIVDARAIRA